MRRKSRAVVVWHIGRCGRGCGCRMIVDTTVPLSNCSEHDAILVSYNFTFLIRGSYSWRDFTFAERVSWALEAIWKWGPERRRSRGRKRRGGVGRVPCPQGIDPGRGCAPTPQMFLNVRLEIWYIWCMMAHYFKAHNDRCCDGKRHKSDWQRWNCDK